MQNCRHVFRELALSPGFLAVSLLTLTIGIALNTCAFSLVNALWFRPPPFRDASSLVVLRLLHVQRGILQPADYGHFAHWRARSQSFQTVAAIEERTWNLGARGTPATAAARVRGAAVSAGFIETLGYRPVAGRIFLSEDFQPGAERVVLIGERFWRNQFGSRPEVIGSALTLDGRQAKVIGILPYRFRFLFGGYQVVAPLETGPARANARRWLEVVARLGSSRTMPQAQAEMSAIARSLAQDSPSTHAGWDVRVMPLKDAWMVEARRLYPILLLAAGLVLLIVCANLSNLALARSAGREREFAVRVALGAGRAHLIGQVISETILIALAGGTLAAVLCGWVRRLLIASYPEMGDLVLDFRVLAFTFGAALVAGLLFGIGPALAVTKPDLAEALKPGGPAVSTQHAGGLRATLVIAQIALAAIMLSGTMLLIRCVLNTRQADPGFPTANLTVTQIFLPESVYPTPEKRAAFYRRAAESLKTLPGVEGAATSTALPIVSGPEHLRVEVEGRPARTGGDYLSLVYTQVSTDFLALLRVPLLWGRSLRLDDRAGGMRVAVVNDAMRRALWPDGTGLPGGRIRISGGEWLTVVGITGDVRQNLLRPPFPQVFVPEAQDFPVSTWLVLRSTLPPASLAAPLRARIERLDPDVPVGELRAMESLKLDYLPRVLIGGLAMFAIAGFTLAAIGLYGLASFFVTQRKHELGVRIALGATGAGIARLVLWQGLRVAVIGAVFGLVGSLGAGRLLSVSIWGVSPADPLVLGAVLLALLLVALTASYLPARRAMRLEPAAMLRFE